MYARHRRLLAAALVVMVPAGASACDACLDGRIAGTVDHAVNQRAADAGDLLVYCAISGPFEAPLLGRTLRGLRGVQAQSLRISERPPGFSFAVDAKQQSPQAVVDAAHAGVDAQTRLRIVRVLTTLPPVAGVPGTSAR